MQRHRGRTRVEVRKACEQEKKETVTLLYLALCDKGGRGTPSIPIRRKRSCLSPVAEKKPERKKGRRLERSPGEEGGKERLQ